MRTSSSPARPRMRRQGCCRSVRCQPGLRPAITHGLSSSRGREVSNRTAEGASGTARPPVLVSVRQRINLIYCKRTIIFVSGERCNQDECGCHQSSDPLWTQLAPDGNAVARGASVRSRGEGRDESAGAGASLRCSFRVSRHGVEPGLQPLGNPAPEPAVRSAVGPVDNSLSMDRAAVCMASGTDRRRSVSCFRKGAAFYSSTAARSDIAVGSICGLETPRAVARPIRAGGCPVRAPCRARPAQAPENAGAIIPH